jgi:hypothetical protein
MMHNLNDVAAFMQYILHVSVYHAWLLYAIYFFLRFLSCTIKFHLSIYDI